MKALLVKSLLLSTSILLITTTCYHKDIYDFSELYNDNYDSTKYENLNKFDSVMGTNYSLLEAKYCIKWIEFDVECIYGNEDLTKLIKEMLDLGGFQYQLVKEKHDDSEKQYVSIFQIAGKNYEFRTSSEGDYIDLEIIIPILEKVTRDNNPDYEYNISNLDGGQVANLIFAKSSDLRQAVDEGFPCSLESGYWQWDKEWQWGVYSDIQLKQIPDFEELKTNYHQTLQELYKQGFNVPDLTIKRIYIDDIFKGNQIDIMIDGGPLSTSSNDIVGNKVRCFWDSWGVLLAYTLVKYYNGKPTLYDKEEKETTVVTQQEYQMMAEKAFGKRLK
ncbi:hypothetical protein [Xanthocytophaga agilis]|uniref:Lipoprotein n=1 Tax=Xanthocytophaga agilis TaxID=3048010 RepID=A0AAE3RDK9_9BACT|nr:hypothetical protein [Xanthocytophaga agilis]MDJ1506017.1 hypothetical protein [Xanthocytophaga agilis]